MFTGIIKNTGKIYEIYKNNNNCVLKVSSKIKFKKDEIGSSVSCSGACLTVETFKKNIVSFYLSKETLNNTIFINSKKGDIINLEKSLKFGERISGHFVQGHVDTTCKIKKINHIGKSWLLTLTLPKKYKKNIIRKGSVTINGVSLTISNVLKDSFQIAIIPKTLKLTNLVKLKVEDLVNVEFDIINKYMLSILK